MRNSFLAPTDAYSNVESAVGINLQLALDKEVSSDKLVGTGISNDESAGGAGLFSQPDCWQ